MVSPDNLTIAGHPEKDVLTGVPTPASPNRNWTKLRHWQIQAQQVLPFVVVFIALKLL